MKQFDKKHLAILDAATTAFLRGGYLATNMEQIAKAASVSKQTVYKHFASKEELFLRIVEHVTARATASSYRDMSDPDKVNDVRAYLIAYATRELAALLVPEVMQLRRLVIGEAERFPKLAQSFYRNGPQVGFATLAHILERFDNKGLLHVPEPRRSAEILNWMILAHFINRAMFLGDAALPDRTEQRQHAERSVQLFISAHSHGT